MGCRPPIVLCSDKIYIFVGHVTIFNHVGHSDVHHIYGGVQGYDLRLEHQSLWVVTQHKQLYLLTFLRLCTHFGTYTTVIVTHSHGQHLLPGRAEAPQQ